MCVTSIAVVHNTFSASIARIANLASIPDQYKLTNATVQAHSDITFNFG